MNSVFLNLGIIQIKWYSIFILLAVIIAYFLFKTEAKKKELSEEDINNIVFYGFIIGIIGARTYYVLFNLDFYLTNPLEILQIWHGGLAIHGGVIAALIFLIIYTRKKRINLILLLDIIVIGLILAQSIGRWGNFFNQEAFGRIVSKSILVKQHIPRFIINGMYISGYYREPTFLYESILSFIGFIVLNVLRITKNLKTGIITSLYLTWYGMSRLAIESLRTDSLMLGFFKIAQLISLLGIISGVIILILSIKKNNYYKEDYIYRR